ncbi:MAG: SBBP repeat-containing protein [Verrucomicrobia bacterium]|nr:SBBP repeat-containing protein [Verrucomicrobiota bacterium]
MRGFFSRRWRSERRQWMAWGAGILMLFMGASGWGAESGGAGNPKQALWNQAGSLHVPFVENRGQISDPQVRFYARTFGGTVYVLQSGDVVYALPGRGPTQRSEGGEQKSESGIENQKIPIKNYTGLAVLKESFGAGRRQAPMGDRPLDAAINSFLGADPACWQAKLPTFEQVSLGEVIAGIQLTLRAHGNSVEKIFTVTPGGDPLQIRVSLEGSEGLAVNERGELEAATALGIVRFSAPVAWQTDAAGRDVPVAIAYAVDDDAFGFAIGAYDPGRPLMIDPLLSSTFVGGRGSDYVFAVAVESSTSNIIVAGATASVNFPTKIAYQPTLRGGMDVFISKFDYRMTNLIASTYLGGTGNDVASAMAIDTNLNIFVAGYTESTNFPLALNTYSGSRDGFVVKLDSSLIPSVSAYLGGSGTDAVNAIAVSPAGYVVYAAGYTESSDFPIAPGGGYYTNYNETGDGFVARFDSSLAREASTFLGGSGQDAVSAMAISVNTNAVGAGTNVFVAGYTWSTNFPRSLTNTLYTNSAYTNLGGQCDAFVSRFNSGLTNLDGCTYLGGTNQDFATAICLDIRTNVYVAGYTYSTNFPVSAGAAQGALAGNADAFIASLSHGLTNRIAATYLGGSAAEQANGMAIGYNITPGVTNILIVGTTASANFPVTANATYGTRGGGEDAFIAVLTTPLTNRYAVTYLGGAGNDRGMAAAFVGSNDSVVAAGYTASSDFPISDATYSTRYNLGAYDGFVSRLASTLTYGTKKWHVQAANSVYSSPCMGPDGTIYAGTDESPDGLYAINQDGATKWQFPAVQTYPVSSPMIGTNGIVYIGSYPAASSNLYVYAVDATNGTVVYSNNWASPVAMCMVMDNEGYLYAGSGAYSLRFIKFNPDLTTNRVMVAARESWSSPALGTNNDLYFGVTYMSTSAPSFYCLNTLTGVTNAFIIDGGANFQSSPAIGSNGSIIVGNTLNHVFNINPNGTTNWVWTTTGPVNGSPVIGTNGIVYVGTDNNLFYAFNSLNGTTQWIWNLSGPIENAAAIGADGTVYVGAGTYLFSLNPVTGTTNWSFSLSQTCRSSSPLIGMDGTIYIGSKTTDNKLYAIYGPTPPEMNAPWPKFHHDMMNSGRMGLDHRPSAPVNVVATRGIGIYTNSVMVTWSAVPYATVYEIYRSTTNLSSGAPKIASTSRTNYLDNINVIRGQMYFYWIKAKAPLGISGFSVSDVGGTLPEPPTGIYATKGEGGYTNSILITWDEAVGATGYQVWRSESSGTNTALPVGYPVTNRYEDAAIVRGLRYYYWVITTNMVGLSGFSSNGVYGGTPPLAPPVFSAGKGDSPAYLPVTWTAPTGATAYVVYSNVVDNVGSAGVVTNIVASPFNHYGLMPCRHYYYWLRATNEFGISGYTESDWGWRALAPPSSVSASDGNYTAKISVSWVVGNTNLQETTAHLVYRSSTNDTSTAVACVELAYTGATMTNYDDIEIVRGPVYYYWVRARNSYGTSDWSQVDSGGTVPLPPTAVIASDGNIGKITVDWTASSFAATYDIYRSPDTTTNNASRIGTVSGSVTSYDDTTAAPGVIYYFWVRSVSPYGSSVFSGSDFGWRDLAPPLAVSAGDGELTNCVVITWSTSVGASAYEVWRNAETNSAGAMKLVNNVATNVYQDTAAIAGVVYYYWVKAKTDYITSGFSSPDSGYRAIGKVDIGVTDFVLLPTVLAAGGHPDAVSFRIENYGNEVMTAPNYWVMSDFYLSANQIFGDGDDVWIGAYSNSVPLSVRTSAGIVLTGTTRQFLTIPDLPLGRYYAFIHVRHCLPSAWNDPVPANNTALRIGQTITINNTASTTTVLNDYNGDGLADLAVYNEGDGRWYVRTVEGARIVYGASWGEPGYQPVVGDYDDNGSSDLAVYHEASGYWFIRSVSGALIAWRQWWGAPGYKPVPGDYNGDRQSDFAVYHEADGLWYVSSLAGETIAWAEWWGAPGYQAVPGDYDADGKFDFAVYHEADGYWYIRTVSGSTIAWATWWGSEGYQAVPGDYDGDGASDMAVYNQSTGYWFIQSVSGQRIAWAEYWGSPDYVPVPGDYNGDGIYDLAVYHESSGLWYIRTLAGVTILFGESWGAPGYKPVSMIIPQQ